MTSADLLDDEPSAASTARRGGANRSWSFKQEAMAAGPFWAMLGLVAIAPLLLGSVPDWAWTAVASLQAIAAITWAVLVFMRGESVSLNPADTVPAAICFGLAVLWAIAQTMPGLLSDLHHPIWAEAANAGLPVVSRISIDPEATWAGIARLLSYATAFTVIAAYCRSSRRAQQAFYVIAIAGTVYAAYGLLIHLAGIRLVAPWATKLYYLDSLTSTFVNRNTYATYAGLTLLCVVGLLLHELTAKRREVGKREALRELVDRLTQRGWILLLGVVLISTALLLTKSRGGVGATFAGLAALGLAAWLGRAIKRRTFFIACAVAAVVGAGFFVISGQGVTSRLQVAVSGENVAADLLAERNIVYDLTTRAISDNPLLGTGLGTFAHVFQLYRDETVNASYQDAHNTYLENALELGIPAAFLLGLSVAYLAYVCARGVARRRRDQLYPAIGLAATVLVATHALVDFSLEMPAVTWTYVAILAVAVAQSRSSRSGDM